MPTWSAECAFLLEADDEAHARTKLAQYLGELGQVDNDERIVGIVDIATIKPAKQLGR